MLIQPTQKVVRLISGFGHNHMKLNKRIIGVLCVIFAALPPHVMYAMSEDGNLWNIALLLLLQL